MASKLNLSIMDYGGEIGTVAFQGVSIGGANYDAQVLLMDAIVSAVQDVSLGTVHKRMTVAAEAVLSSALPASQYAQRENKWLVRFHDNVTGDRYTLSIPCADLTLLEANGERMDPTNAAYTALKAAIEAYVKVGEVADNPVIVDEVIFVARNI